MARSDEKTRRTRALGAGLGAEALETRQMMTGGVGNTFAILPATIAKAGGTAKVTFNLDPKLFTDPGNKPFVLGIDVAPGSSSTANPTITSIAAPGGKSLKLQHTVFDAQVKRTGVQSDSKLSSATLVTVPGLPKTGQPMTYTVNVKGLNKSSGDILLGFYLPGDATGTGKVDQAGINATQFALNVNANDTSGKYSFDADANRDGVINKKDVALAKQNMGIGTTVSPVISANLSPTGIADPKNRIASVSNVSITGVATPDAAITYASTTPGGQTQTVTADAVGNYTVPLTLTVGANNYNVTTSDGFKQKITGAIAPITYTPGAQPVAVTAAQTGTTPAPTATSSGSTTTL